MEFPTKENEIERLAMSMLNGYWHNMLEFPRVDRIGFLLAIRVFQAARDVQTSAVALLKTATKDKREKLDILKDVMRDCLKKSEVDVAANPEKLKLIGWGTRGDIHQLKTPNQPTNLKADETENEAIRLSWRKGRGKQEVRNFIIERRQHSTGSIGNWQLVASCYENQIILNDQPQRINLEYRIKAKNTSGQSMPSNTAYVTI